MTLRRWPALLVSLSLVAGGGLVAASTAAHAALAQPVITPCEQIIAYPEGDALLEGPPPLGMGVPEPDLDITQSDIRVTAIDLIDTITVAQLGDSPTGDTGDYFFVLMQLKAKMAQFGYVRDVTGGHPLAYDAAASAANDVVRMPTPLRVAPFYDKARSQVTLTIPRAAIATAFGVPQRDLLLSTNSSSEGLVAGKNVFNGGENYLPVTNHAQVPLSFEDCDNYLASHPDPVVPDPAPCGLSFDAPVGDEVAQGTAPERITDDDTDITHVDVLADASAVTVTEHVARLGTGPLVGSGHRFGVAVSQGGLTAHIGADQESAAVSPYVTKADGTAGASSLTATFDTATSQFRMVIPRADWDALFGGAGAAGTVDHLAGESSITTGAATVRPSDTGAVAPGDGRFSVADCDASVSAPAPTTAPTTTAPPIAAPNPIEVPIGGSAPTTAPPTTPAPSDSPTAAPTPAPSTTAPASPAPSPVRPTPTATTAAPQTQAASTAARVTSVRPGAGALSVAFTPATGSGISGYLASCTLQGSKTTTTVTGARSPIRVTGLLARRTYVCSVRPKTSRGLGADSNTQTGRPGAVPKVTLVAPKNAKTGQLITLTGTASASGTPVTNRSVVITFRADKTSKRTMIALTKTDAKGHYTITLTNPGPGAYQATVLIESLVTRNREVFVHHAS